MTSIRSTVLALAVCSSPFAAQTANAPADACESALTPQGDRTPNLGRSQASLATASSYLAKANAAGKTQVVSLTFDARSPGKAYALQFNSGEAEYFAQNDVGRLADRMHQLASVTGFLYWLPHGFDSRARESALEASVRVQWAKHDQILALNPLRLDGDRGEELGSVLFPTPFFEPGIKLRNLRSPEQIRTGEHQGWFRVLVDVIVNSGTDFVRMTVTIIVKTAALAGEVGRQLQTLVLRSTSDDSVTAAIVFSGMKRNLRAKYPDLSDKDIVILMQDEFGSNYLVMRERNGTRLV